MNKQTLFLVTSLLLPIFASLFWMLSASDHSLHAQNPGITYYIALDGNDQNPGTLEQPFATLNHAVSLLQPGDTVYFRGGTYYLSKSVWIGADGLPEARISIRPYQDEHVVLDCSQTQYDTSCIALDGSYLDFEGFEIASSQRSGIAAWGGSHLRIRNNAIHHSVKGGIYVGYDISQPLTVVDVLVEGNEIYRNCQENNPVQSGDGWGWPPAISIGEASLVTVTNNLVYENYGEGIIMGSMNGGVATHNVLHDNYSVQMYMDKSSHITYQSNLIYTTHNTEFFRYGGTANGIQMANEWNNVPNPLDSNKVLNNMVIGGRHGFYYGSYDRGGGMRNVLVANNTFYEGQVAILNIDPDPEHQNTLFVNNLFYQTNGTKMMTFAGDENISFHHNAWYGGSAGIAAGEGDVTAPPRMANPGGITAQDYFLTDYSPLINAGSAVDVVNDDYFGSIRPSGSGYDIGAYEYEGDPPALVLDEMVYLPLMIR